LAGAPTPTRNATLPFRRGGFSSLCDALGYAAQGETGLNFFDARGRLIQHATASNAVNRAFLRPAARRKLTIFRERDKLL
jgi:hypothetical protein